MTVEQAEDATRNGAIVACISAGLTTLLIFLSAVSASQSENALNLDAWSFLDVALLLLLAYGTYRKSRTAAVSLVLYKILDVVLVTAMKESATIAGTFVGFGIAFIFFVFYVKAAKGAFVYQQYLTEQGEEQKPFPKWAVALMAVPAILFAGLIGIILLDVTEVTVSYDVLQGGEVSAEDYASLLEHRVLLEGENIEYFYSQGLFSILEGGYILTGDTLISYTQNSDGDIVVESMPRSEIRDVALLEEGSATFDARYMVYGAESTPWLIIELPAPENGSQAFLDALQIGIPGFN